MAARHFVRAGLTVDAGRDDVSTSAERVRIRARWAEKTTLGGCLEGTMERTSLRRVCCANRALFWWNWARRAERIVKWGA